MPKKRTSKITTEKTLSLLYAGELPVAKRYAGKHVLVVRDKVVLMKEKHDDFWKDIERLKKKYGEMPTMAFVPRRDITYILLLCK